jgi:hypothetical protein
MRSSRRVFWLIPALWACTASDDKSTDTDVATDTDDTDVAADTDVVTDTDDTDAPADTDVVDPGDLNPCGAATPTVTLGTGAGAYTAVAEGSDLTLTKGAQGGWHFWMAVSVQNSPQYVVIEHSITRLSDGTLLSPVVRENDVIVPTTITDDCVLDGVYYGMQGRVDTTTFVTDPPWQSFCGESVRMDVKVYWPRCSRYDGQSCLEHEDVLVGEDSVTVVAKPDPTEATGCGI